MNCYWQSVGLSPGSGSLGAVDEPDLANLEELKRVLVDGFAVSATTIWKIVNNRAPVALGPRIPLEGDIVTGSDDSIALGVG